MNLEQLENIMRSCRKCENIFLNRHVDPLIKLNPLKARPVFAGTTNAPVMLIGQAPGIKEYELGKAFQGQAGGSIRNIFAEIGINSSSFDDLVYQTSVTKCFPGRKIQKQKNSRTGEIFQKEVDREPSTPEIKNCVPYLTSQIALIKPQVIVLLGQFAIKTYMQIRGQWYSKLKDYVGRAEEWNGSTVIFFPHTSGNSRWFNDEGNRRRYKEAKQLLAGELKRRKIID